MAPDSLHELGMNISNPFHQKIFDRISDPVKFNADNILFTVYAIIFLLFKIKMVLYCLGTCILFRFLCRSDFYALKIIVKSVL